MALRNRIYVTDATLADGRLQVTMTQDGSKFDVLNELDDRGVVVGDFSVEESSLEDLFARYTTDDQEVST